MVGVSSSSCVPELGMGVVTSPPSLPELGMVVAIGPPVKELGILLPALLLSQSSVFGQKSSFSPRARQVVKGPASVQEL